MPDPIADAFRAMANPIGRIDLNGFGVNNAGEPVAKITSYYEGNEIGGRAVAQNIELNRAQLVNFRDQAARSDSHFFTSHNRTVYDTAIRTIDTSLQSAPSSGRDVIGDVLKKPVDYSPNTFY